MVSVSVTKDSFEIKDESGNPYIGYITTDTAMNFIIEECRLVENLDDGDGKIIAKLFANTPKLGEDEPPKDNNDNFLYELRANQMALVERNPYKYVSMIDHFFNGAYQTILENETNPDNYTISWLFAFAKNYHLYNLEDQSNLLSDFNSKLSGENSKKQELLDMVNSIEEQSKHRLQTRNRLSFINKDQIERMRFKNNFLRRTLFYLCLIIFVAFSSQLGLSLFVTNALCFILFVTWAIHSFIMYNTFNTRHNLQFRMQVYNGNIGNIAGNNTKYKNRDRCPNYNDEDDKPKGKC